MSSPAIAGNEVTISTHGTKRKQHSSQTTSDNDNATVNASCEAVTADEEPQPKRTNKRPVAFQNDEAQDEAADAKGSTTQQSLLASTPSSAASASSVVHVGFSCDQCGVAPIIGVRHHCQTCDLDASHAGFDVCSSCLSQGRLHDESHVMVKLTEAEMVEEEDDQQDDQQDDEQEEDEASPTPVVRQVRRAIWHPWGF